MVTRYGAARAVGSFGVLAFLTGAASAQAIRTPNLTTADGPVAVTVGDATVVNQGLQGVGRLPATTRDFLGDTLGSFSALAIDLASWRRSGATYSGTLYTLPDRGYNDPSGGLFSDYAGRLNRFNLSFTPDPGAGLPQLTASQRQIAIVPNGGIVLTDANGRRFSGLDPASGTTTQLGAVLPSVASGPSAGRISLDAEGLARRLDGSFYVSDEYGPNIYYFSAGGQLQGVLGVPDAIRPRTAGALDFNSINPPDTGRRNNQGFEALSLAPDGRSLVTILQSATLQDSGPNQQQRNNTRILIYDLAGSAVPAAPAREYVLQLPTYRDTGNGGAPNRTAAQSDMLALNDTQFLVLSRDSNGLGTGNTTPIVYKSVLLVDIAQATNIAGPPYDGATPISPGGTLRPGVQPAQTTEIVNLLNPVQLGRFGMNLNTNPATQTTLSEKFEALGLVPVLSERAPNDYFLLVGNDNDFLTRQGSINGQGYDAGINNDSVLLAYRLTLPTYVDPLSLAVMKQTAPVVLQGLGGATLGFAASATRGVQDHLAALRRGQGLAGPWSQSGGLWIRSDVVFADQPRNGGLALDRTIAQGSAGLDLPLPGVWRAGVAVGGGGGSLSRAGGFRQDQSAFTVSAYAGYYGADFYAQGIVGGAPEVSLDGIRRPAAYGLTASGRSSGSAFAIDGEAGVPIRAGDLGLTLFAGITHLSGTVDGFTETGAAGNNIAYRDLTLVQTTVRFGGELAYYGLAGLIPSVRLAYNLATVPQGSSGTVRLASVQNGLATAAVAVPFLRDDFVSAGAGLQGSLTDDLGWRVDYQAAIGTRTGVAHGVTAGLRYQW
ncbi:autotransporter outer membrane beta-barrel domain-containing protein [Methylobacterium sp. WL30]|uniref:esterase-like activity of phytase family protein n=1 Tax=unclassified Methylobacterium TaxID=2615210 RepID=UPI0011C7D2BC|nr:MULTISPECIES: esterase-like activity of phytase family protein [unclassified Methylobacterium]TXN39516.1 autotransporter outer membrane beta-barrel domain-containing protein [Methylobacterium sp. WL93]TXN49570.1 autotransporter outer membrane beta-barrel domain-containing protein [Methylobacterium sp. WL119]TXN65301.1 autotransporter outer membrane beta-barrel domain-containing protein [Methylobacterium sp. WL30]